MKFHSLAFSYPVAKSWLTQQEPGYLFLFSTTLQFHTKSANPEMSQTLSVPGYLESKLSSQKESVLTDR